MKVIRRIHGAAVIDSRKFHILDEIKGIHPLNPPRSDSDPEDERIFTGDIRKRGVEKMILLSNDGKVLRGQRRYNAAVRILKDALREEKKGGKAVSKDLYYIDAEMMEPIQDLDTLKMIIHRDNALHKNRTEQELEQILFMEYTPTQLMERQSEDVSKRLERVFGTKAATWKHLLARVRQRLAKPRRLQMTINPEDGKYLSKKLAEYDRKIQVVEQLEEKLAEERQEKYALRSEINSFAPKGTRIKGADNKVEYIRNQLKNAGYLSGKKKAQ